MPPVLASFVSAQVLLFLVFGFGALVCGIMMTLHPNPVRSALFLVLNLFCVAVLYLLLNAYFLAAVQVIVYAGAIMVLFLFVIMLLNLGTPDRAKDRLAWQQPIAVGAGLVLAALFSLTIYASVPAVPTIRPPVPAFSGPSAIALDEERMGTVEGVGRTLYDPAQPWLFPFEMTSILLLIAVVGSVVLAKRRLPGEVLPRLADMPGTASPVAAETPSGNPYAMEEDDDEPAR